MRRFVEEADRGQWTLLPECLDDFIDESNPVRVIEVFVDALDLAEMSFEGVEPAATGRPRPRPKADMGNRITFWRRCSATCGVLSARLRLSRTNPTFSAASLMVLQSPFTMASIAARTFFEMRRVDSGSVGAGFSRAASARLAGVPGGVTFFMPPPSAPSRGEQCTAA